MGQWPGEMRGSVLTPSAMATTTPAFLTIATMRVLPCAWHRTARLRLRAGGGRDARKGQTCGGICNVITALPWGGMRSRAWVPTSAPVFTSLTFGFLSCEVKVTTQPTSQGAVGTEGDNA